MTYRFNCGQELQRKFIFTYENSSKDQVGNFCRYKVSSMEHRRSNLAFTTYEATSASYKTFYYTYAGVQNVCRIFASINSNSPHKYIHRNLAANTAIVYTIIIILTSNEERRVLLLTPQFHPRHRNCSNESRFTRSTDSRPLTQRLLSNRIRR